MTGCFAVVVAVLLAQKAPGALRAAYGWCLFGIADLVVAVTMGAMTSPGPAHLLAFDAPHLLISSYPLVMHPFYGVPLALMLHGLVLWRLRRESASAGRLAAARCLSSDSGEGGQLSSNLDRDVLDLLGTDAQDFRAVSGSHCVRAGRFAL